MQTKRLLLSLVFCAVIIYMALPPNASAQGAYFYGGVYGWGRPSGVVKYIDKSLQIEDLPGVIGMYGELIHDNGGLDNGYTIKAQSILNTDTLQGYIAINNYKVGTEIQKLDAWTNSFLCDTYTVTGGTAGDMVEAIFTCTISGIISIEPLIGTDPNSHGTVSFNFGMHGTYGDPAIIPNWIDAGMYLNYSNGTLEILANDVYYYDDWDDDEYDLDRHAPIFETMVEGQDYTISGNMIILNASFEFPVTMISGHALEVESELDLSADTADIHFFPNRAVEIIADFWNTGVTNIALAPEFEDTYRIVRESRIPEPTSLSLIAFSVLFLFRRFKA